MCGISGLWSKTATQSNLNKLRNSLNTIRHRGPDDVGIEWIVPAELGGEIGLGLTRLAVLDLSTNGHQPMKSRDSRFTISFNGEITNYIEIRNELRTLGCSFHSDTDTEVLLQTLQIWGVDGLTKLEGMFAFALFDSFENTLTVARDVFGIKPFFYSYQSGVQLAFSSEIAGVLELLEQRAQLDWQTAANYLEWGIYDSTESTFIEGVKQLPPGHFMVFDLKTEGLSEPQRYWWPEISDTSTDSFKDAVEQVRFLFLESVEHNLRSDVPVGVALSGGIDSSAIASAIRYLDHDYPLQTFSFVSPGFEFSEEKWIERVVFHTNAHSHLVEANPSTLAADLDEMIVAQGEPFGSTSIYAQFRVFQKAREEGVVVTLDGQGADELFAGYSGYPSKRLHSLIETGKWNQASRYLNEWSKWPGRSKKQALIETAAQFLPMEFTKIYLGNKGKSPLFNYDALKARQIDTDFPGYYVEKQRGKRLKSHLRAELTNLKLPALLRHGDRNSMHFSVESRVPFLSKKLAEYVFSLPESYISANDGSSKSLLRAALRGITPDEILDRRDKIGFATPENQWLKDINWEKELSELTPHSLIRNTQRTQLLLEQESTKEMRLDPGGKWRVLNLLRWARLLDISLD